MKKVAFYGRYSTTLQTEQSIEGQRHVCEKYAEQNGLQIVAEYVDRAISGTSDKRPQFQQMIADAANRKFEHILVYKLDRFARNRYDSALYKKKLRDHGVTVLSATEAISNTPEGIIMEGLLEAMDEYYSAELARKSRRGREESFRKGRFLSTHVPFGYKNVDHHLEIDEATAPIVKTIFERYAAGDKLKKIEIWLNGMGIRNAAGNEWDSCSLSRLVHRTYYYGEYKFGDFEGVAKCPAIISRELWDKAQERLAESRRRRRENRTNYDYILTGKLYCAEHHRMMSGISSHGKFHRYRCLDCHHVFNAEELQDRVLNALQQYLSFAKLDQIAQAAFDAYMQDVGTDERPAMEAELKNVEKQLQNAVSAVLNGFASDALKDTMQDLEARKQQLQESLNYAPSAAPKFTLEQFKAILGKVSSGSPRELLDIFVNRIIKKDDTLIICINLTDESNVPPLEQIMCSVADGCITETLHIITMVTGWLVIAA